MHFFVPFMIMAFIYIFGWRITLWLVSVLFSCSLLAFYVLYNVVYTHV